ncbi:MAG: S8 family peptidase [Magnetococcales bacterium]|nr:S8 family peptidase [Magnetococcales bacterium]
MPPRDKKHIDVSQLTTNDKFKRPKDGGNDKKKTNKRDRLSHGSDIQKSLKQIKIDTINLKIEQAQAGLTEDFGLLINFSVSDQFDFELSSFGNDPKKIEVRNIRQDKGKTHITVFVPDGKLEHFEKKINEYLNEETKTNKPRHKKLIEAIDEIRISVLKGLWTDTAPFPTDENISIWWEIWLSKVHCTDSALEQFNNLVTKLGMKIAQGEINFPERKIILIQATPQQLRQSFKLLNRVAEIRLAKETADFFLELAPKEQKEWATDLYNRVTLPEEGAQVPHICILDTGINNGHILLQDALSDYDCHSVNPSAWGVDDRDGHGTEMAGLSLYGDLIEPLSHAYPVQISHRLESVKLLQKNGDNADPALYGHLTWESISRVEIEDHTRQRVFSMAITTDDDRDKGRPSAWSGSVDNLSFGNKTEEYSQRLFILSAGNLEKNNLADWLSYPDDNSLAGIQDPGQSWNALTVGAFTNKVHIPDELTSSYQPLAKAGALSPYSTTSSSWDNDWPLKPDVLFEGGNLARDNSLAIGMDSLQLLTTSHEPTKRLYSYSNATSAATAQCARMAAQLMAEYPDYWPETIRGLIVHSAEWTKWMTTSYLNKRQTKGSYKNLVRHCGFGIPDIEKARKSAKNDLVLIAQNQLHPFKMNDKKGKSDIIFSEIGMHDLPWPTEDLERLGNTSVELRVTLSYFIEANPSERGFKGRYHYPSHNLRFFVKRPVESFHEFQKRVNEEHRDDTYKSMGTKDTGWLLGTKARHRGSLHTDIWKGPAVDLAQMESIAIQPVTGWWKTLKSQNRYNNFARYTLLVSIRSPETKLDLYNLIEKEIENRIAVKSDQEVVID